MVKHGIDCSERLWHTHAWKFFRSSGMRPEAIWSGWSYPSMELGVKIDDLQASLSTSIIRLSTIPLWNVVFGMQDDGELFVQAISRKMAVELEQPCFMLCCGYHESLV